jgi:hypothetical protein
MSRIEGDSRYRIPVYSDPSMVHPTPLPPAQPPPPPPHRRNGNGHGRAGIFADATLLDWFKISVVLITLVVAAVKVQIDVQNMREDNIELRGTVIELRRDIQELKIEQAKTQVLLQRLLEERRNN